MVVGKTKPSNQVWVLSLKEDNSPYQPAKDSLTKQRHNTYGTHNIDTHEGEI